MDRMTRAFLFAVGAAVLMLAVGRQRLSPGRFLRPLSSDLLGGSRSSKKELNMDQALASPQTTLESSPSLTAGIGAIASTVAAEQELALRAANKAALHRRNVAELRAMYVRPLDR